MDIKNKYKKRSLLATTIHNIRKENDIFLNPEYKNSFQNSKNMENKKNYNKNRNQFYTYEINEKGNIEVQNKENRTTPTKNVYNQSKIYKKNLYNSY